VVVVMRAVGRGRESGIAVEYELARVWTVRDGLAIRHKSYPSRDEALEAAGLRE
jgi:ketosteroid isomerase-like protein